MPEACSVISNLEIISLYCMKLSRSSNNRKLVMVGCTLPFKSDIKICMRNNIHSLHLITASSNKPVLPSEILGKSSPWVFCLLISIKVIMHPNMFELRNCNLQYEFLYFHLENFMTGYNIVFDREKNVLGWKASNCEYSLNFFFRLNFNVQSFLLLVNSLSSYNKNLVSPGYDDENFSTLPISPSHSPAHSPAAVDPETTANSGTNSDPTVSSPSSYSPKLKPFHYTLAMLLLSFLAIVWLFFFKCWAFLRLWIIYTDMHCISGHYRTDWKLIGFLFLLVLVALSLNMRFVNKFIYLFISRNHWYRVSIFHV